MAWMQVTLGNKVQKAKVGFLLPFPINMIEFNQFIKFTVTVLPGVLQYNCGIIMFSY